MDLEKISKLSNTLATQSDSDVFLYTGSIGSLVDNQLLNKCSKSNRRKNAILILCTNGGDPDAGYKISRSFQQKYENFTVLINGVCKSAGTLITVGANEIVMSDAAEIGPLDVQIGKKDELETDSGLTVLSAIKALEDKTFELFETSFLRLKARSSGRITLKSAMEMANKLAIGTITPVMSQIDPMHVGEVSRAMNIGLEYGKRLDNKFKNCKFDTLSQLANAYPSHGFVIDRDEVKMLFNKVREPIPLEAELLDALGNISITPQGNTIFEQISDPVDKGFATQGGAENKDGQLVGVTLASKPRKSIKTAKKKKT